MITNVSREKNYEYGFYMVRRNETWRNIYYRLFEEIKSGNPSFEEIITYMYKHTGNIEPSFSSKMLATINSDKPIWDRLFPDYKNISSIKKIDSILWSIR